jgi:hypothetical protein
LEIDDTQHVLRIIDEDPGTGDRVPYQQRRAEEGRLFMPGTTPSWPASASRRTRLPSCAG